MSIDVSNLIAVFLTAIKFIRLVSVPLSTETSKNLKTLLKTGNDKYKSKYCKIGNELNRNNLAKNSN